MKPKYFVNDLFFNLKTKGSKGQKNTATCVRCFSSDQADNSLYSGNCVKSRSSAHLSTITTNTANTIDSSDCISNSTATTCSLNADCPDECYHWNDKNSSSIWCTEYERMNKHRLKSSARSTKSSNNDLFDNKSSSSRKFTKSQKQCLICILSVCFAAYATMSLIAPFFPDKARKLGLTDQQSGLTFSVYAISCVVFSPIMSRVVPMFGAKNTLLIGILCNGLANIAFGLTQYIGDGTTFFWVCIVLRIIEAFGTISHICASYTYVIKKFPNDISYIFGLTESACGAGLASGPALGGLIYSVSGYGVPFYIFGSFVLFCLPITWFLVDDITDADQSDDKTSFRGSEDIESLGKAQKTISLFRLLFKFEVIVNSLVIVLVASANSFFFPTLQHHLESLNVLNLEIVALEFFLGSSVYVISTLVIGKLLGEIKYPYTLMLFGVCFTIISLMVIGPSDLFYILNPGLINTSIGMILIGIGTGAAFIPTFECYYKSFIKFGLEDSISTYGIVAALWSMMFGLGEAIGPLSGGYLASYFNFQDSASIMACTLVVLLPLLIAMVIMEVRSLNSEKKAQDQILNDPLNPQRIYDSFAEK